MNSINHEDNEIEQLREDNSKLKIKVDTTLIQRTLIFTGMIMKMMENGIVIINTIVMIQGSVIGME